MIDAITEEKIVKLLLEGIPQRKIAQIVDVGSGSVWRVRNKYGIEPVKREPLPKKKPTKMHEKDAIAFKADWSRMQKRFGHVKWHTERAIDVWEVKKVDGRFKAVRCE